MPPCIDCFIALATTVVALAGVSVARADSSASPDSARWGFYFNLGAGANSGGFHPTLEKPLTGEFGILRARGQWRYGMGVSFSSFVMPAPYDKEKEWGFQEVFLTGTAAEITPVGEIDSHRFTPGTITKALMADFDKAVGRG